MPQVVCNCPLFPQQISRAGPAADKRASGANHVGIELLEKCPLLARIRAWLQVRATVDENC
jgi:hypothetical protein